MAKKGINPLFFLGGGCLVVIVIAVVIVAILFKKGKDLVQDFTDNPAKAIAVMAIKNDPNLELRNSDDAKGTITYFDKQRNTEITVDWSAFKDGKLVVKEGDKTTTLQAGKDGASITGPDGTTVLGGQEGLARLPDWVPVEGLSELRSGMFQETSAKVNGVVTGKSSKPANDLLAEFKKTLEAAGYQEKSMTTSRTGNQVRNLGVFEHASLQRTLNVVILEVAGTSQVTINYEQAK